MARQFDGVDDYLKTADNAVPSLDVDQRSFALWILKTTTPGATLVFTTLNTQDAGVTKVSHTVIAPTTAGYKYRLSCPYSGTTGQWITGDISLNVWHHLAVIYDQGATTNDPTVYVDGQTVSVTESATPVGTKPTGGDSMKIGIATNGGAPCECTIGNHTFDVGTLWTAAEVNRHMWWGMAPGGPSTMESWYPFWTDDLKQKGTAGGDLTASGPTMASMPKVQRPSSACMGFGVGL